ncbi:hypothetical protein B0H67DRAFT_371534 [Lasiosphaeris hirsuta]|uniref:Uncharacterized protein n=1 Tax=Lasiosphaeris hirsuta TaxID=260670 RepID=A0AA39ZWW9_9PEZI|nr:hypothetical protein B0H67DRAFT_371534 [Lasiosphaeris hirsuta]
MECIRNRGFSSLVQRIVGLLIKQLMLPPLSKVVRSPHLSSHVMLRRDGKTPESRSRSGRHRGHSPASIGSVVPKPSPWICIRRSTISPLDWQFAADYPELRASQYHSSPFRCQVLSRLLFEPKSDRAAYPFVRSLQNRIAWAFRFACASTRLTTPLTKLSISLASRESTASSSPLRAGCLCLLTERRRCGERQPFPSGSWRYLIPTNISMTQPRTAIL